MRSYHQRYTQEVWAPWRPEQARRVWTELVSYGATIRTEPLFTDAWAVAAAMMERVRHNLELLIPRLHQIDYRFAYPQEIWIPPPPDSTQQFARLEQHHGPLPLVLHAWFTLVGSVNFMGNHPKLCGCAFFYDDPGVYGLGDVYADPLVVDPCLIPLTEGELDDYQPLGTAADLVGLSTMPFASDATLKAGESGSGWMYLLAPNAAFDGPIIDDGERWTGTCFIPYLQECFAWGGFPGLRGGWYPDDPWDPATSHAELAFLRDGLLPLI